MMQSQLVRSLLCRPISNAAMLAPTVTTFLTSFTALPNKEPLQQTGRALLHTSASDEAARKGTRARREAIKKANKRKKVVEEVKKKEFIPFELRDKLAKFGKVTPRLDVSHKPPPPDDDIYIAHFHLWKTYSIEHAVEMHRESHHPSIYNMPAAPVYLFMELSMSTDKAKRYLDDIRGVLKVPHPFPWGAERQVAVLSDQASVRERAQEMGVQLVGGKEIVKLVLDGEVDMSLYDHIVASLDILPDLVPIRGILKKSFPSARNGTAVLDVLSTADCFLNGLKYDCVRDKYDLDYAHIDIPVGTLTMNADEIAANVEVLIKDVAAQQPTRKSTDLISTAFIKCPPTTELFAIDFKTIGGIKDNQAEEEEESLKAAKSR
uniref:39S ribosomal protein L1 n=2 Tax=Hirondellea gigas TaxID=1518452 RepID=A0A6A7FUD8_9CRUS